MDLFVWYGTECYSGVGGGGEGEGASGGRSNVLPDPGGKGV